MEQRLTVHLTGVKGDKEERKNRDGVKVLVPVIKNTLSFIVNSEAEVALKLDEIQKNPTNQALGITIKKYYLSNLSR